MVFDSRWFVRHQRSLLALANAPGVGREFRSALEIELPGRIVAILPHTYTVIRGENQEAEFRTQNKFARRLHHEGMPLWKIAHWFDMRVANPWLPSLNLGFDTLTAYPDPDPETTTVDGYASRFGVDEDWATIVAGAGAVVFGDSDTTSFCYTRGSATTNQFDQLRRLFFLFDTSSIGAGSTVSAATLSVWGLDKANGLGSPDLHVCSSAPASNTAIAEADYSNVGSTSFGSASYAGFDATDSVYTDIALNASGIANVTPAGISKFGARLSWDINNSFTGSWVTNNPSYFRVYDAENVSGTAHAPKLVVTFMPPTTAVSFNEPRTLRPAPFRPGLAR